MWEVRFWATPQYSGRAAKTEPCAIAVVLAVEAWRLHWHEAVAMKLHSRDLDIHGSTDRCGHHALAHDA